MKTDDGTSRVLEIWEEVNGRPMKKQRRRPVRRHRTFWEIVDDFLKRAKEEERVATLQLKRKNAKLKTEQKVREVSFIAGQ
jgi:hypothetical protein